MSIDKSTHLGGSEAEIKLTELELQIWRIYHTFVEWQETCEKAANSDELSAGEIGVLHVLRFKDRPKTITEVGQILNRDNFFSINYNMTKLLKMGLVEKVDLEAGKKQQHYMVTQKGIENTERYNEARQNLLIKELNKGINLADLDAAISGLARVRTIYEEASKATTLYQPSDKFKIVPKKGKKVDK